MRWIAPSCLLLCVVCSAQEPLAGLHRIAVDDCGREGAQPRLVTGGNWTYPAEAVPVAKVPAADPLRTVAFGSSVVYRYQGLKAGATYKLRLSFLSDSAERRVRVRLDGQAIIADLALPQAEPIQRVIYVPTTSVAAGVCELSIDHLAGPNAVISLIELFSSDAERLRSLTVRAAGDLAGTISGHVVDAEQAPAANVAVSLTQPAGDQKLTATTGADGAFRIAVPATWRGGGDDALTVTAKAAGITGTTTVARCEVAPPRLTPLPVAPAAVSLDGTWKLTTAAGELPIEVPGEWVMQGAKVAPNETVTYQRSLSVPAAWTGQRVKLRFDAVYSQAEVLLDGKAVGGHLGGFTPFEIDITDQTTPASTHDLRVRVTSESVADRLASGSQYAAHPLGGISRSVRLCAVPAAHLARLHATTTFSANWRDATVHVAWTVVNEGPAAAASSLALGLSGPDGKPAATGTAKVPALAAGAEAAGSAELTVTNAQTWDPEHPRRYRLSARLADNPPVERLIGLKQVQVRGNQVFCNNRPIKLHGVCRHEVHPRYGRALRDGLWHRDAELFKAANINFVRTSHYPPAEAFLDACDEVGIFVEDEAPFCWAANDPANRAVTVRQALEMVERDLSHPSVLHWSVANETQWGANFDASAQAVARLDPSRPRIFSYGDLDIASWHYPGPNGPANAAKSAKPVLFDEYCHLNCYNRRELDADPGLRDEWGLALAAKYDKMWATQACLGGSIWAGIDDIFRLPDGKEVGYGSWGPVDGWRRPKPEYYHVRKAYSPIRVLDLKQPLHQPGQPVVLRVENRFDFTDLNDVTCTWRAGAAEGQAKLEGAPHQVGKLTLALPAGFARGTVDLRFGTANQEDIDAETIDFGGPVATETAAKAAAPVTYSETPEQLVVTDGRARWTVSRATGQLGATVDNRPVLAGGPSLMMLPLAPQQGGTTHGTAFQPWNDLCTNWKLVRLDGKLDGDAAEVTIAGSYSEAEVIWSLRFASGRSLSLKYRLTAKAATNPRQIGPVFDVVRTCDTLTWDRVGQWSSYPATHLGRLRGTARPEPPLGPRSALGGPTWPWELDPSPLGCNDFRASRRGVTTVSLTDRTGLGWQVRPLGGTARAWVDGERLRLLAATVDCGTSEGFVASLFGAMRHPLKPGDVVEGEILCGLVE
ncbi:MAG: carboxypeptidase regulatory-like domain-containing protein [Armatimonadetes bacterium]|nr:carboxypeptidase regulatory-like domain-containing protein [Armatimonadota bacterium]